MGCRGVLGPEVPPHKLTDSDGLSCCPRLCATLVMAGRWLEKGELAELKKKREGGKLTRRKKIELVLLKRTFQLVPEEEGENSILHSHCLCHSSCHMM